MGYNAVFSSSPVIECSLIDFTAALIRPLRYGLCMNCWKVANRCLCNCHSTRLKKDATSFKNMGRFGLVLVKLGRFGLILVKVDSAVKFEAFRNRLGPEWFRLWAGLVQLQ